MLHAPSPPSGELQSVMLHAIDNYDLDMKTGEIHMCSFIPPRAAPLPAHPAAVEPVNARSAGTAAAETCQDQKTPPLEQTPSIARELPLPAVNAPETGDARSPPPAPAPLPTPALISLPGPPASPAADYVTRAREEVKACVYGVKAFEYNGVNTNGYRADCMVYSITLESMNGPYYSDTRYFAAATDNYEVAYFRDVPVPSKGSYSYLYTIKYSVRYSGGAERSFTKSRQVKTFPRDRGRWYTETDLLKSYEIPSP